MLYTDKEVSKILKVNVSYVYKLINKKLLLAIKLGSQKIRLESLERFLNEYEGQDLSDLDNIHSLSDKKTAEEG